MKQKLNELTDLLPCHFKSQKKCLDFAIEQKDPLDASNRMSMIYAQVTHQLGSGKPLLKTGGYDLFMESKWNLTYLTLLESYGKRPDYM